MDKQPNQTTPEQPQTLPEVPPLYSPAPTEVGSQVPLESSVPQQTPVADTMTQPVAAASDPELLEWRASEYVEHEKSKVWFLGLGGITIALLAIAIFIIQEYTFAVLVVVMAVAVAVWAKRPASEMQYRLEANGLSVNGKFFTFRDFRAFGVLQEGAVYAVVLLPNKRFSPGVNVYFPHELGERIVDVVGAALPMETVKPDIIDTITRRLNF